MAFETRRNLEASMVNSVLTGLADRPTNLSDFVLQKTCARDNAIVDTRKERLQILWFLHRPIWFVGGLHEQY